MKNSLRLIQFILLLIPAFAIAQPKLYQRDTSIKVFASGKEQTLAWCGGFNNPQFSMADLNHDGLDDLVVFENWGSLRTFINVGSPGHSVFRYVPEYANNFPPVYDYCILLDYNRDGIPDLFEEGQFGFAVHKGYYNSSNQLCFTFYENLWYKNDSRTNGYPGNAFTNPGGDIPAIVDVDGDGDLDFIAYNISGGNINWYRNMQVEDGLPKDSIKIDLWTNCWGEVYQGLFRNHTLAAPCDNSTLRHGPIRDDSTKRVAHSGNTPCLFDYDMDGDMDYIDGSVSYNEMTFLLNGRIPFNPSGDDTMVYQDTMWQSISDTSGTPVQVELAQWVAAFNLDVDQDGKKDLIMSPMTNDENYKCIWYYKNYTTPGHPDWRFQSDSFLVDQAIDLGNAAYPMLFDYDKDGMPDLFIGSDGYYQSSTGGLQSRISYYRNTGTPGHPEFTLISKDFLGLSVFNFKGIAPAFGDIDGDGKADLIIGHTNGTLSYFKNWAVSDTVTPIWELNQLDLTDMNGDTINVTGYSAPFMYDVDKDGKKDLVIGNTYGTIHYYQNANTTPGTVNLKFVNESLGNAKSDPKNNYNNHSTIYMGPIDTTGVDYLIMGSNSGNIYKYTGFQSGDTTATYTLLDSQYSYIDSFDNEYAHHGKIIGLFSNYRTSVTIGDIGKDGSYEMITGNVKGGCELYKWKAQSTVGTPPNLANEAGSMKLYPNPASDKLRLFWSGILEPEVEISIINMEGQRLYAASAPAIDQHLVIDIAQFAPGMYVCQLQSGVNRYYSKFTVVR